jgi:acetylornithine deacetylase/succinyl-diaminopimelate desuccinylase-like protein
MIQQQQSSEACKLLKTVAFSRYVKELMTAAGLTVREDPMGNIFGRWEGTDPNAGAGAHSIAAV